MSFNSVNNFGQVNAPCFSFTETANPITYSHIYLIWWNNWRTTSLNVHNIVNKNWRSSWAIKGSAINGVLRS